MNENTNKIDFKDSDRFEMIAGTLYQMRGLRCRSVDDGVVSEWWDDDAGDNPKYIITLKKAQEKLEEWGYVVTLSASASDIPPLEVTPEMKANGAMIDEVRKNVFHEFMDGAPVRNYSADIVAACRYVGEHWTGDDGHLVSQAADRIEQLESLVLANDKERHLSGQLKNSAEMSEEAFSDLFSRWRASAAEYNRLRKLTYIPTKGEG